MSNKYCPFCGSKPGQWHDPDCPGNPKNKEIVKEVPPTKKEN